ncbi:MAG: ribonuclease HI [Saprospiraceae bacterium]|jgi:ribonuclease HI
MAKKKQKYYVVWQGMTPGVYSSWKECQLQINGYPAAKYKSFNNLTEAEAAYGQDYNSHYGQAKLKSSKPSVSSANIIKNSLSVDAACSGSPGTMEYRGVWTNDKTPVFHKGPFIYSTNNVGEFLALVHGISWLQQQGMNDIPIYSDSRTAIAWLRNRKTKTTLIRKDINKDSYKMLDRAVKWVQTNEWQNPILKWETSSWGEIPADFGRK